MSDNDSDFAEAAKRLTEGVIRQDPMALFEAFRVLERVCDDTARNERAEWSWEDRPYGFVGKVRLPDESEFHPWQRGQLPLAEAAFMNGLRQTLSTVTNAASLGGARFRMSWKGHQILELLSAVMSDRPFAIDVDRLNRVAKTGPGGELLLRTLEVTVTTAMRLWADGVIRHPIYLSDADMEEQPFHGWEGFGTGSVVHRGDLLPMLLPDRRDDLMRWRAVPEPVVDEVRPLALLDAFTSGVKQTLDRGAGTIRLDWPDSSDVRQWPTVLKFSRAAAGDAAARLRQDVDIRALDAFIVPTFFRSSLERWNGLPAELTFIEGKLWASRSLLAERQDGRWVAKPDALMEMQAVLEPTSTPPSTTSPVSTWDHSSPEPLPLPVPGNRPDRLRLHIQVEPDSVMLVGALDMIRKYPEQTVWIQVDSSGGVAVLHGEALLRAASPDTPLKIEVSGHGMHDVYLRQQTLSGYSPKRLVNLLHGAFSTLKIEQRAGHITLMSCALEAPAVTGSYGSQVLDEAIRSGLATDEATLVAYGQLLSKVPGWSRRTTMHPGKEWEERAPEATWSFHKDASGEIVRTDKYPRRPPLHDTTLARFEEVALFQERFEALSAGGAVIDRFRPSADHRLVPVASESGPMSLSFDIAAGGEPTSIELVSDSDRQAVRAYLRELSRLTTEAGTSLDPAVAVGHEPEAGTMDMLNVALLAQALMHVARGSPGATAYQSAVLYLGATQGGLSLGAEAIGLAQGIRQLLASTDAAVVGGLDRMLGLMGRGLRGLGVLAQVGVVGLDVKNLMDALDSGSSTTVAGAALQLGLDTTGLVFLAGVALAASLGASAGGAADLIVPFTGLAIGFTALQQAVASEMERLRYNLQPLHKIDEGYDTPLQLMSTGEGLDAPRLLITTGWAPVNRIDFVAKEVGFADATIGESSIHRAGVYQSSGNTHDWQINDGSDHQGEMARSGRNFDLWSLLRRDGRTELPVVALDFAQGVSSNALVLMTSPVVDIDFDTYSGSRAGGDGATLDDALLERIQQRSNDDIVGDYVTSSSMAKSADLWRYGYRKNTLTVTLDNEARQLVLPGHLPMDRAAFTFKNGGGHRDRSIHPLDQSLVDYRLVGGGGHTTLMLPGDGTVRNPVTIAPSGRPGESWTFVLEGAINGDGKLFEFLAEGDPGFRLNGQTIRFESVPNGSIAVVDPSVPDMFVTLDLKQRQVAPVMSLRDWYPNLDAAKLARGLVWSLSVPRAGHLGATQQDGAPLMVTARLQKQEEDLSGYVDLKSGRTVLCSGWQFLIQDPRADDADGHPAKWTDILPDRVQAAEIGPDGRPIVVMAGNDFVREVRFVYDFQEKRFKRAPLALTDKGEAWLTQAFRERGDVDDAPAWHLQLDDWARQLAHGIDLGGPSGDGSAVAALTYRMQEPTSQRRSEPRRMANANANANANAPLDPQTTPDHHIGRKDLGRQDVEAPPPYRALNVFATGFSLESVEGDRYQMEDEVLRITLAGGVDLPHFDLGDSGRAALLNSPVFGTLPIRWMLLQGNGRIMDLTALTAQDELDEVVILPEADGAMRRLHFMGEAGRHLQMVYDGMDLILFNGEKPDSSLIRVRHALRRGGHAAGHALYPAPDLSITVGSDASRPVLPPSPDQMLNAPMLTLRHPGLILVRDGGDLLVQGADQWDRERLTWFFDPDAPGGDASQALKDTGLLVRRREDGEWRTGALTNAQLLRMVAEQERVGVPATWSPVFDGSGQDRVIDVDLGATSPSASTSATTFSLQAQALMAFMAGDSRDKGAGPPLPLHHLPIRPSTVSLASPH